jgi:hypothetical protein
MKMTSMLTLSAAAFVLAAGSAYAQGGGPPAGIPPVPTPPVSVPGPPAVIPPVVAPPVTTPVGQGAANSAFGLGVAQVAQETHSGEAVREAALANGHASERALEATQGGEDDGEGDGEE